jgi:tripartite-type tricarboxylate transporter receptor subunit TctC
MKLKTFVCLVAAAAVLAIAAGVQAQAYPTKPIKIIVPQTPGGNVGDIQSRLLSPILTKRLGQPVVVENRPGAGGMIGTALLAKAQPDGYTLASGQAGPVVVVPHTNKNVLYDPTKDFAAIAMTTRNYMNIYARPQQPFKTLPEMIAYAKANPDKLTVATNGEGAFPHLTFEHLRILTGFTYHHVPYKSSSQSEIGVLNGECQVGVAGASVTPQIKAGKLILLASTGETRAPSWPDKPCAAETVPGYSSAGWFGFIAPAGTPKEIINRLNAEINLVMNSPDVAKMMADQEMYVVNESPKYFEDAIKSDYVKYGKLVRDIGFQPR